MKNKLFLSFLASATLAFVTPGTAKADLYEIVFTGTGQYYDYAQSQWFYNANLVTTYLVDDDLLPADNNANPNAGDYYDYTTDFVSASLQINGGVAGDESDLADISDPDNNYDHLYIRDFGAYGHELLQVNSYGNDSSTGVNWNTVSYWYDYSDFGCVSGEGLDGIVASCDTNSASYGYQYYYQHDGQGNQVYAYGYNVTSVTVNNIDVPEPGTLGLLGLGILGIVARRRRTA